MTRRGGHRGLCIGLFYNLREDFPSGPESPADAAGDWDIPETIDLLREGLETAGYQCLDLGDPHRLLEAEARRAVDLVLSICEMSGARFRESLVPSLCELLGLPYMLSGPDTLLVALDKNLANLCLRQAGLRVAPWSVVSPGQQVRAPVSHETPLVVKPIAEGSGMGVCLVTSSAALEEAVHGVHVSYHQPALVQKFLPGREFTVGVLERAGTPYPLGVVEVLSQNQEDVFLYDYDAKETSATSVRFAPFADRPLAEQLQAVAIEAFKVLGCRDGARVDLRLDDMGTPHFLEINPLPHLHPQIGDFCRSASACGIEYPELLHGLVASATERWRL
jgi:D-alanine-D-alanine ligase